MTFFLYFPYPDYKTYLLIFVSKFCLIYFFTSTKKKFFMNNLCKKMYNFARLVASKNSDPDFFLYIWKKIMLKSTLWQSIRKTYLGNHVPMIHLDFNLLPFLSKFNLPWTGEANIPSNTHKTVIYLRSIVGFSIDLSFGIFNRYPETQHTYTYIQKVEVNNKDQNKTLQWQHNSLHKRASGINTKCNPGTY